MKASLTLILFFFLLIVGNAQIKVMTYNIKYDNPKDSLNNWDHRRADLIKLLLYYSPDIIGIQEGLYHQVEYIKSNLPNYDYVGVGRDDGKNAGEFSCIFFNTQKFKRTESKTYWLSETPEIPSKGWDAALNRITTYVKFKDISNNKEVFVFNAHYDHMGVEARNHSSELIMKLIHQMKLVNKNLIVMGDFNSEPQTEAISIFKKELNDSHDFSQTKPYGPIGTFNNFDTQLVLKNRIDYIFIKNFTAKNYRHIDDRRVDNLYPSDHLPVFVELFYNKY